MTRGRRILIVEDDRTALNVLKETIVHYGYLASIAGSGHEAIEQAKKHDFEGVLLDLGLPDMKGIDVLLELRRLHPTIPILIVSGRKEYEANALAKGAKRFPLKAFRSTESRRVNGTMVWKAVIDTVRLS